MPGRFYTSLATFLLKHKNFPSTFRHSLRFLFLPSVFTTLPFPTFNPPSIQPSSFFFNMRFSLAFGVAAALATADAQIRGFNYGASFTTGAPKYQADFEAEFNAAKNLPGAGGFTSARIYTMIQAGTTNTPISAIPAAIATKTTLLLGLWASAGQVNFNNEIAALNSAIGQYGTAFTDLITGISVGSEDLYRNSPTGIINKSGVGAQPDELVSYITQVRQAIQGTAASAAVVGHVDTWTAYVNVSNNALIAACDFLGMDAVSQRPHEYSTPLRIVTDDNDSTHTSKTP
jgi:glucan endo-1,3-beta-D-glucosidase